MSVEKHIHVSDEVVIKQCLKGNTTSQKILYDRYKSRWYMVCLRYLPNEADAKDALQNALIKIYTKMNLFDSRKGNFDAWSKRVVVNECIMVIRKNKRVNEMSSLDYELKIESKDYSAISQMSTKEILKLVTNLPEGYRAIFNMYAIEGYTHKEIANQLSISEGTSKSQLFKAKKMLKKQLESLIKSEYEKAS